MMIYRKKTFNLMCDFETTVDEDYLNQEETEVWCYACCEIKDDIDEEEDTMVGNSIDDFFEVLDLGLQYADLIKAYFHNLRFDGQFILDYLINVCDAEPLTVQLKTEDGEVITDKDGVPKIRWAEEDELQKNSFCCCISSMGQWYSITYCNFEGKYVRFLDSSKLIPLPVSAIQSAFGTKHGKLDMEYVGERHAGGEIKASEKEYVLADVLTVAEALNIMFNEGLDKITIGACAKAEYRSYFTKQEFNKLFPNLATMNVKFRDGEINQTVDSYLRKAYKGGWCYLQPNKADKLFKGGCTADVNSLYPSMLLDNKYPFGEPVFFKGKVKKKIKEDSDKYYFVRLKTRFYLKKDHLPTIQIKGHLMYDGTEWLTTSDVKWRGKYYKEYKDLHDNVVQAIPELTLTKTDYEMLLENYDLEDTEYLDGCWFGTVDGKEIFSDYINKWATIKKTTKDKGKRQMAKMMLNSLTGKFGAKIDSTTKLPYVATLGDRLQYSFIEAENTSKAFYLPIVAANTSYARKFTITAAQANYEHFIYADTDSIHCHCEPKDVKGIKVHPSEFSCWKLEATWDEGIFTRQKTYIEHVIEEDQEPCKPYYNIKCAGMDKRPKELLNAMLTGEEIECKNKYEEEFMKQKLTIQDFKIGLKVPGKLMSKTIRGGVLLVPGMYCMR